MNPKPGFEEFWLAREDGFQIAFNRWMTSHAAALAAYVSHLAAATRGRAEIYRPFQHPPADAGAEVLRRWR